MSTFAQLRTSLSDRGFSHLSATRLGELINNAYHELDEMRIWPYREAFATGASPLSISNLGVIEMVLNTDDSTELTQIEYGALVHHFNDLSIAGDPQYYYLAYPSGTPVIATYPTSSSATIGVQYYKVATSLSADGDIPTVPTRFHNIIVEIAVRDGYLNDDNQSAAQAQQQLIDMRVARMTEALFFTNIQGTVKDQRLMFSSEDW